MNINEEIQSEIWIKYPNINELEISSKGRVRFLGRRKTHMDGKYLRVQLPNGQMWYVHRLVCWAFNGPPGQPGLKVRHLNGITTENWATNLEWGTQSQNNLDLVGGYPAKTSRPRSFKVSWASCDFACPGVIVSNYGEVVHVRELKQIETGRYLRVSVPERVKRKTNCHAVSSLVHVLVCTAFHGENPGGMQVRHLNGNIYDNRPENLVWGLPEQNYEDRSNHARARKGKKYLTKPQRIEVAHRYSNGEDPNKLSAEYQVTKVQLSYLAKKYGPRVGKDRPRQGDKMFRKSHWRGGDYY